MRSLAALLAVLFIQFVVYLVCFRPYILQWGATREECSMSMPGDKYAEIISCTRAVDIHAPAAGVWPYLADLGADRGGFYSYYFLERLFNCEIVNKPGTGHCDIPVGRLVPYTKPDSSGKYHQGFTVIEAEQGQYFVLKGWGEFRLREMTDGSTRFLVRTHWKTMNNVLDRLWASVFDAGHYIMERRMMLGIKDYAESAGKYDHAAADYIWFFSVIVSGLAGLMLVFTGKGYFKLMLPCIFLVTWQFFLFVLNPRPVPGMLLVLLVIAFGYLNRNVRTLI